MDVSSEGLLLCQQQRPQSALTPWRLTASGWLRGEVRSQGRAGHCTLVYREMQRKHRQRDREWEDGGDCGGRVTASVASQCPRQEEIELCAADCLTETQAAGWWHFMVTTWNPTNFSWWKSSFSKIEQHRIVVVTTIQRMTDFHTCFNSQKLELGLVPYGGITYFASSTVNCKSFIWKKAESVP